MNKDLIIKFDEFSNCLGLSQNECPRPNIEYIKIYKKDISNFLIKMLQSKSEKSLICQKVPNHKWPAEIKNRTTSNTKFLFSWSVNPAKKNK